MGPGPKVVLEPVPGREFLQKSEWSVPRPEIPKKYQNRENGPRNGYEKRPEVVGSPGMNSVLVWRQKLPLVLWPKLQ